MHTLDISHSQEILTVSRLNREVKFLLEGSFSTLWIEGEISNFSAPHSGHWYFSLKDRQSQVRCAMFRTANRLISFKPKDGMQVLVKANISLYEGRGDYQLIVEHAEEAGEGKLRQAFEALKKRLLEAGLFDPLHKKKLPRFPNTIGIITSPTGAAIRDTLSILRRRYPGANVIIYQTQVQGELAAANIVNAIQTATRRAECDVLILTRGGGSLEDLWSFNEEIVAYAIHHCPIPLICGVGHEIDFTIADFVADVRAPTPSAAAELVTPAREELLDAIHQEKRHLLRIMQQKLIQLKENTKWLNKNLDQLHPKRRLTEQTQKLDIMEVSLVQLQSKKVLAYQAQLQMLSAKLTNLTPARIIREIHQHLLHDAKYFRNSMIKSLHAYQNEFSTLAGKLDALSPLATLKRGFSIVTNEKNQILSQATLVNPGDRVNIQLSEGTLACIVEKTIV